MNIFLFSINGNSTFEGDKDSAGSHGENGDSVQNFVSHSDSIIGISRDEYYTLLLYFSVNRDSTKF